MYTGRFDNDEFNGRGKIKFGSLDVYEGEFIDGRLEGHGLMEYTVRKVIIQNYARIVKQGFEIHRTERFTKDRGWTGNGVAMGQPPTETVRPRNVGENY